MAPPTFDCQACGACCCNPNENRALEYPWYVEVDDPRSPLLRGHHRRLVAFDPEGQPHLRLDGDGRCVALVGRLGGRVRCTVYAHRPRGCRRVQPGDPECLRSRRERFAE